MILNQFSKRIHRIKNPDLDLPKGTRNPFLDPPKGTYPNLWMKSVLWCYHSNETSSAVLSHGTICLGYNSTFWVCGWIPMGYYHSNRNEHSMLSILKILDLYRSWPLIAVVISHILDKIRAAILPFHIVKRTALRTCLWTLVLFTLSAILYFNF